MEEILDPKGLRKMVCSTTRAPLSMGSATSPLTAEWVTAAARESDPLAGRQSSPQPTASGTRAGFLRLIPSSNKGKVSVHRTEVRNASPSFWNGNRIARGERCSPRGSVAPHHCFG